MNCPFCETQDSKVVDSRYVQDGIRRRRECLMCSLRFTTYEKIHTQLLSVIKRDNTKEAFSIEKLTKSISTACKKKTNFLRKNWKSCCWYRVKLTSKLWFWNKV